MSKSSKKTQISLLVNLMESQPAIARGFFKGNKEEVGKFWQRVELDMNAAGPPMKNIVEWKKVWAEQKRYVRQKASENLKHRKGTGERKLSPSEEAIYNLFGLNQYIDGENVPSFGLQPLSELNNVDCVELLAVVDDSIEEENWEQAILVTAEGNDKRTEDVGIGASKTSSHYKPLKRAAAAVMEDEIKIQSEICAQIKIAAAALTELHGILNKISQSLDKICNLKHNHYKKWKST